MGIKKLCQEIKLKFSRELYCLYTVFYAKNIRIMHKYA